MQYLLMIYANEQYWDQWDEATQVQYIERYQTLIDELKQQGVYLASERLLNVDMATSVRRRNGEVIVSDGPFAETKEQLGGFFLVECRDLDHATEVASRIPSAEIGTIEVRPLWYQPESPPESR